MRCGGGAFRLQQALAWESGAVRCMHHSTNSSPSSFLHPNGNGIHEVMARTPYSALIWGLGGPSRTKLGVLLHGAGDF